MGATIPDSSGGRTVRRTLRLGTRSSLLALAQADIVASALASFDVVCEIVELDTIGDRHPTLSMNQFESNSPFTDDVEAALLRNEIDIAVHSLKDMPLALTPGLAVAAILERGDPRESIVTTNGERLDELPTGAVVGTSCARRAAQILSLRRDLRTASIRGPVDDRIRQVREGAFDAAVLAIVGLRRSGLSEAASEVFSLSRFVSAPAQAALAVQVREHDAEVRQLVAQLDHGPTREAVETELAVLAHFDDRDDMTIAAVARHMPELHLRVRVLHVEGRPLYEGIFAGRCGHSVAVHAIRRVEGAIRFQRVAG